VTNYLINIGNWRDDTDSDIPKYSDKSLFQCHFGHPTWTGLGMTPGFRGERTQN